jgi:hypothetical protein
MLLRPKPGHPHPHRRTFSMTEPERPAPWMTFLRYPYMLSICVTPKRRGIPSFLPCWFSVYTRKLSRRKSPLCIRLRVRSSSPATGPARHRLVQVSTFTNEGLCLVVPRHAPPPLVPRPRSSAGAGVVPQRPLGQLPPATEEPLVAVAAAVGVEVLLVGTRVPAGSGGGGREGRGRRP